MKKILLLLAISNTLSMTNSNFSYNINSSLTNTIKSNDEINFLATADIHAGYPQSVSNKTISVLAKHLPENNNRGVIISGDLTGYVKYTGNLFSYKLMLASISNHLLTGFGNHDSDTTCKVNQTLLNQNIVKQNAMTAAHLLYYTSKNEVPVYSWNWLGIHFVQCSLAPINKDTSGWNFGRSDPGPALTELQKDLEINVGLSNMPIVLAFHYGYDDFSIDQEWWSKEQRTEFENAILAKYNVILMLTGHQHFVPTKYDEKIITVNVGKKTIYDVLSGTALFGGYSEISINKTNKEITIKRHNVQQNDEIVINKKIKY
ncbi:metallophosphoesterase [Spiroplasma endosymbiont of Thecophora atra]|uniref:metallophosphoesterase n=1 Tax=Spiroplasma endosymbiont of Thecophora atra TaxID=3066294 RepID=UPI0030D18C1F